MKRVGFLYEKLCDEELLKLAIHKAARGKTRKHYVRRVLDDIDGYAAKLKALLETQTIELKPNKTKTIYDHSCNKERVITVPRFYPDQIIHWAVMIVIERVIRRGMYRYCCGSVPGRGGKDAKRITERAVRDKKVRYVAKLDVRHFFNSVKGDCLMAMLRRKIKDEKLLNLIDKILKNSSGGLPIGYYTSQWLSNFYLEGFDHFVKEQLKVRYYIRYVDDMVLLDTNKRRLHRAVSAMDEYLHKIGLELKPNWQIWRHGSRPIDFVGFRFYPNRTELRTKIYLRLCRRVRRVRAAGYTTVKQARGILSLLGWLQQIKGHRFYTEHIYPYASRNKLKKIISDYDKRRTQHCLI